MDLRANSRNDLYFPKAANIHFAQECASDMRSTEIITIGGTRPELIKLSKFVKLLRNHDHAFVYTGQHYSANMKEVFLDQLGVKPDHDLGCATSDTITIKSQLGKLFREIRPRFVVVYGDT